jgi:hypothetical protein
LAEGESGKEAAVVLSVFLGYEEKEGACMSLSHDCCGIVRAYFVTSKAKNIEGFTQGNGVLAKRLYYRKQEG